MIVADYIATYLAKRNVPAVFELPGGMIAFISDAIYRLAKTPITTTRHEQAAGFAAEAATRISRIPAVALGTSGPGATNLLTPISSCFFDSTPTIFITGQVNQIELKKNSLQRQNGFQELDIVSLSKSITKYSVQVLNINELKNTLDEAWRIALDGRPGPVLIDIPIDVQQMEIEEDFNQNQSSKIKKDQASFKIDLDYALSVAKTPVIVAGGGIQIAGEVDAFRTFVDSSGLPVLTSLMGLDSIPTDHPQNLGMIGSYGNSWANVAISKADLLIVLGSRLDVRQTGPNCEEFIKNKEIIRIDIDQSELEGRIKSSISHNVGLKEFFDEIRDIKKIDCNNFINEIKSLKNRFPQEEEQTSTLKLNPSIVMGLISKAFFHAQGYLVDVGQHQMWAAQSLILEKTQRMVTSGGLGAMGFALPAAIGAAKCQPGVWVVITGDGCAQLSINELQTIKQEKLNIIIFVFNNHQHGMVAQFQETNMSGRYFSTRIGYSSPDFFEIAKAYGINAFKVDNYDNLKTTLLSCGEGSGPILVEIDIPQSAKALPKQNYSFTSLDL